MQDPRFESELSAFCLDHRHRIFIAGDNTGGIRAYNFSNGALMKQIEGDIEEKTMIREPQSQKTFKLKDNPVTMSKSYAKLLG